MHRVPLHDDRKEFLPIDNRTEFLPIDNRTEFLPVDDCTEFFSMTVYKGRSVKVPVKVCSS